MTVIVASVYLPYAVTLDLDDYNSETLEVSHQLSVQNAGEPVSANAHHGDSVSLASTVDTSQTPTTAPLSTSIFNATAPASSIANSATATDAIQTTDLTQVAPETKAELPDIIQTLKESTESSEPRNIHTDPEQDFFLGKNVPGRKLSTNEASGSQDENSQPLSSGRRRHHLPNDNTVDGASTPGYEDPMSPDFVALECSNEDVDDADSNLATLDKLHVVPSSVSEFQSLSGSLSTAPDQSIVPTRKPVEVQHPAMRIGFSTSSAAGSSLARNDAAIRRASCVGLLPSDTLAPTHASPGTETQGEISANISQTSSATHLPDFYKELEALNSKGPNTINTNHSHSIPLERLSNLHASRNGRKAFSDLTPLLDRVQFKVEIQKAGNGGLRNALKRALARKDVDEVRWVGYPGISSEALSANTQASIASTLTQKYNSVPVFTTETTFYGCYNHYAKQILWPTMHYQIPDHPKSKAYEDHSWDHYKAFNQAMADAIVKTYKPGDIVWVNDYHLLLVPQMVREKLPDAEIGFFLHIAFPSSEVFRVLAARKELLEGMLAANCIGFQIDEYRRHFLQTCNRILTVDFSPAGVRMNNRFISVVVNPIGIDTAKLDSYMKAKDVRKWQKEIRERYKDITLFVGRDKLDRVKGVKERLEAYELFLKTYPEMIGKVTFIQVCMTNKAEPELESDVSVIVDRINGMQTDLSSPAPCVFLYQDIDFAVYIALLYEASAFVITSLREGMNLTCHEFVYCNDCYGPLILSEFTGSASELGSGAILVNPWDRREMAEAFHQAIVMSDEEKYMRWSVMNEQVMMNTCEEWVRKFLDELDAAWNEEQRRQANKVPVLNVEQLRKDYQSIAGLNNSVLGGTPDSTPGNITPAQIPLDTPKPLSRCGSRSGSRNNSSLNLYQQAFTPIQAQTQKKLTVLKKRIFFLDLDTNTATSIPAPLPVPNASAVPASTKTTSGGLFAREVYGAHPTGGTFNLTQLLDSKKHSTLSGNELNLGGIHNASDPLATHIPGRSNSTTSETFSYAGPAAGAHTGGFPLSKIPSAASTSTASSISIMGPNPAIPQTSGTAFQSPQRKISLLYELANDPQNIVYVVSSDTRRSLEITLERVGNIGIIAENGAYIRLHDANKKYCKDNYKNQLLHFGLSNSGSLETEVNENVNDDWFGLIDWEKTKEWKKMIKDMLEDASEGLPGSIIEEEKTKIVLDVSKCLANFEGTTANTTDGSSVAGKTSVNSNIFRPSSGISSTAKTTIKMLRKASNPIEPFDLRKASDADENSIEEARAKIYSLIGGIVSHVNDVFQPIYNVHAIFNSSACRVEFSSESTNKLGAVKRAFEWELAKCEMHNQEALISHATGLLAALSTHSSGNTSGVQSTVATPRPSRHGSFTNANNVSSYFGNQLPWREEVDMVFIAGEGGESTSDLLFEWGNGLRHLNSNTGAPAPSVHPLVALSSNNIAASLKGSTTAPILSPINTSAYSINNPLLSGSEFTGELNSRSHSSSATNIAASFDSNSNSHDGATTPNASISAPLLTLQNGQQPYSISLDETHALSSSLENGSGSYGAKPVDGFEGPSSLSSIGQYIGNNGSKVGSNSGSPVLRSFSPSRGSAGVKTPTARRSHTPSQSFLDLTQAAATSAQNMHSNSASNLLEIQGADEKRSGTLLAHSSSSPAIAQQQQKPLSGLSGVLSRKNSGTGINKEISAALANGSGNGNGNGGPHVSSSNVSLSTLMFSPKVTHNIAAGSVGAGSVANASVPEKVVSDALSENPMVYTVSIGGTGTYAESAVNGVNGLIQALRSMLGLVPGSREPLNEDE